MAPSLFWEAWGGVGFEFRMLPGLAQQLSRVQACTQAVQFITLEDIWEGATSNGSRIYRRPQRTEQCPWGHSRDHTKQAPPSVLS